MIYSQVERYAPTLKISSDDFKLLDLSLLGKGELEKRMTERAEQLQCDCKLLREHLEDTLLSVDSLSEKVRAIVLPLSSLDRRFRSLVVSENCEPHTPFSFLREKFGDYCLLGLKVDLNNWEQLIEPVNSGRLKKIKLFSFDLCEQNLQDQFDQLRKCINFLWTGLKSVMFHINFKLVSAKGLKSLKQQCILNEYPIEYCSLQTNLLNIIAKQCSLELKSDWQELAFKYLQVTKKYVPSAIGSLLQFYQAEKDQRLSEEELDGLFRCISLINKRYQITQEKYLKVHHNTGICVLEPILQNLINTFALDELSHFKVKGAFDSNDLVKIQKVVMGKYQ